MGRRCSEKSVNKKMHILTYSQISAVQLEWKLVFFFSKFRGPCIVSIFLLIYFQWDATLHSLFISGKLLYMCRVVSPPIIRSTHKCTYSIWYLLNCYCYRLILWKSCNSSTIAAGSSNGLTSTRYCKYSYVCSWWWVEISPETCRAVFQK